MNTGTESRNLWCPMVRFSPIGEGENYKHSTTRNEFGRCIASQCAMWRWQRITGPENGGLRFRQAGNPNAETEEQAGPRPKGCETWKFCPPDMDPAGWVEPQANADARREGYCGLAGKPQEN
ncbi:MAG: hypothetical protein ABFC67_14735 [Mizugakiibacter sp.]|uniref:hypothetical protein n=1 Tax=Mizugakiibacter sp. TaxID=1972610 RepID=UPI00320FCEE0